ncbi:MAG: cupredoxin family copper-binding protein [Thermomicrobia bacterium]|nr:cupredoxin family copper-binding protein [Thermomicrobia bacterium]
MQTIGQMRRYHRALWGMLLALLIAGLLSIQLATAVSADVAVNIMNFSFQPTPLTIPVGTTVVWTNQDSAPHTVTSDTGVWDSGIGSPLQKGATFRFTFTQAGTFPYHCMIHPNMHGTIVVTAAAGGSPTAPPAASPPPPTVPAPSAVAPAPVPTVALPAPPRTGGGGESHFIRRLGDG